MNYVDAWITEQLIRQWSFSDWLWNKRSRETDHWAWHVTEGAD